VLSIAALSTVAVIDISTRRARA